VSFPFDDPLKYVTEFAATIPNTSPSMRLDHLARRRSEIDVINGAVVDRSRDVGLEAPVNQVLSAVVRARESRFD
jgi:2-dehydropantoate 2-reductase